MLGAPPLYHQGSQYQGLLIRLYSTSTLGLLGPAEKDPFKSQIHGISLFGWTSATLDLTSTDFFGVLKTTE